MGRILLAPSRLGHGKTRLGANKNSRSYRLRNRRKRKWSISCVIQAQGIKWTAVLMSAGLCGGSETAQPKAGSYPNGLTNGLIIQLQILGLDLSNLSLQCILTLFQLGPEALIRKAVAIFFYQVVVGPTEQKARQFKGRPNENKFHRDPTQSSKTRQQELLGHHGVSS